MAVTEAVPGKREVVVQPLPAEAVAALPRRLPLPVCVLLAVLVGVAVLV